VDAIERVLTFDKFYLHLSAPWKAAHEQDGRIIAQVNDDVFEFDFVIASTGYFVDSAARPELADFAHHIARWRDRYEPSSDQQDDELGAHPYLGNGHEYQEKVPGRNAKPSNCHGFSLN
jgi:hypothetical protein